MGIEAWRLLDPYLDDVDDLRERIAVALHRDGTRRQFAIELETAGLEMRAERISGGSDDLREVTWLEGVFFLAAFHT